MQSSDRLHRSVSGFKSKTRLACLSPSQLTTGLRNCPSLRDLHQLASSHTSNLNTIHISTLLFRASSLKPSIIQAPMQSPMQGTDIGSIDGSSDRQLTHHILDLALTRLSNVRVRLSLSPRAISSILLSLGRISPHGSHQPPAVAIAPSIAELLLDELTDSSKGRMVDCTPKDLVNALHGLSRLLPPSLPHTKKASRRIVAVIGAVHSSLLNCLSDKDLGILAVSVGNLLKGDGAMPYIQSFSSLLANEVRSRSVRLDLRTMAAVTVALSKLRYRCEETLSSILMRLISLDGSSSSSCDESSSDLRDLGEIVSSLAELRCPSLRSALVDQKIGQVALERSYSNPAELTRSAKRDRRRSLLRIASAHAMESSLTLDSFDGKWIEDLMIQELSHPLAGDPTSLDLAQSFHWMLAMGWGEGSGPEGAYEKCKVAWVESVRQRRSEAKTEGSNSLQSDVFRVCQLLSSTDSIDPSSIYFEYLTPDGLFSVDIAILEQGNNERDGDGQSRIAIEVDGPSHFALNAKEGVCRPLGSTLLRDEILARHGWSVISIPWWEWREKEREGEEKLKNYLSRRLSSTQCRENE